MPGLRGGFILLLGALLCASVQAEYRRGDLVPTSRRGQFHGQRTQWHDIVYKLCPHFASFPRTVVVPVPRPVGFSAADDYKMSLSFDHDRFLTPWLLVMGPKAPEVPVVHVVLTYSGGEIRKVTASVVPAPDEIRMQHEDVAKEFADPTAWPKRLLVHYQWVEEVEVDGNMGLWVLLLFGLILTTSAMSSALLAHETALGLFFKEVVDDRPEAPSGAGGVYRAAGGAGGRGLAGAAGAGVGGVGAAAGGGREGAPSLNSWTPRQPQYPVGGAAKHE